MNYWSNKTVLVTGGSGFLGTHVVNRLKTLQCKSVVDLRRQNCDLTKEEAVSHVLENIRPNIVIHLAGLVGGIQANKSHPADFFYQNLMMCVLTLHYSWKVGAEKYIGAAAGCGYPVTASSPLKEECFWDGFPQRESAPYSLAKRNLHIQSVAYWDQYRFPSITVIPGNIYGPHDNFDLENAHVVPALVRKFVDAVDNNDDSLTVWGTGKAARDFVYADDVARGILAAAEGYDQPQLVNLSMGCATSIRDVVAMLKEITGFAGTILWDANRPEGQAERRMDISKARRDFGFEIHTSLRDGLAQTVDWYRSHKQIARTALRFQ